MAKQRRLRDERPVHLNVPLPYLLRDRLDELKRLLDEADLPGVPLRELIATLVLFAEEDGTKLRQLVEEYRNAPPEEWAIGGAAAGGKVIPFRKRSAGRPRAS